MKIICDLPEYQVKQMRRLIGNGHFSNIESFIQTSVDNQLSLELHESAIPKQGESNTETDWEYMMETRFRGKNNNHVSDQIFDELKLQPNNNCLTVEPPKFERINVFKAKSEEYLWMWGQVNKILPIKFAIRCLLIKISARENLIELKEFKEETCRLARDFGFYILSKDKKYKKERGEKISTAFPIGENPDKAFSRFASHFIGEQRRDLRISGALANLKLVNMEGDYGKEYIGITEKGLEFSRIENPVIDHKKFKKSLSYEEINFYLEHIRNYVPGEAKAFRSILGFINTGINTREEINNELAKTIDNDWSEKVTNTQRAGVTSRLFELGLLAKEKIGITVKYLITDEGKSFLNNSDQLI